MSSWTFENYEQGSIHASYRWNKGNTYETFVGVFKNGCQIGSPLFHNIYGSKEQARRAYKRQVLKIKKGEYYQYDLERNV